MFPHAPRKSVSAEAITRLASVRALSDVIISFPRAVSRPHPSYSQAQNVSLSNDVH
jgi:hypothetical protein